MTKPDSKEIIGTLGLVLIVAGIACWSKPAAMIISGLMMASYAFLTVKPQRGAAPRQPDAQGSA